MHPKFTTLGKKYIHWLAISTFALIVACVPPTQYEGVSTNLSDPVLQIIHDLQDRQSVDSLYDYFRAENPSYRYAAALAFASIQDSTALDSLAVLLKDAFEEVRVAAAFSIGQLHTAKAEPILINAFLKQDTLMQSARFNAAILEAVGKCGTEKSLQALATIASYINTDTLLLEGQSWGIFRYALRGLTAPEGTRLMVRYATDVQKPVSVRVIAANYLHRAANIYIDTAGVKSLSAALNEATDPRIRLGIATGLGKSRHPAALNALALRLSNEPDYRVRCNIVKGLGNFEYQFVQPTLITALADKNTHVANTTARLFIQSGQAYDGYFYLLKAKDSLLDISTRTLMYGAALKFLPYGTVKDQANAELVAMYQTSTDPYRKAQLLEALGEFGWNYSFIKAEGYPSSAAVVKTTAVQQLTKIVGSPGFYTTFRGRSGIVRAEIAYFLLDAIKSGDVGMMAEAAVALREPAMDLRAILRDSAIAILAAQQKLKLPDAIETWNELQQTINYYMGKQDPLKKVAYNHPIDWGILAGVSDQTKATIKTTKGNIVVALYPSVAPGSVSNFIRIAKSGFFNKKAVHRMVTNHVIQSGCPRGDGYGSLDYTIRSEFSALHYDEAGYIGMASAGRNTECSQWFINMVPTPHLDGAYTIFGNVISGMDVVDRIVVGDVVEGVTIE